MANTYAKIATVTVGSGGSSNVSFTSIPATYTDLLIKLSIRTNEPTQDYDVGQMYVNNNQSNTYTWKLLRGNGSSGQADGSSSTAGTVYGWASTDANTANTFSSTEIYIPNYTFTTNRTIIADSVTQNNAVSAYSFLVAGLTPVSVAISQLNFVNNSGNFKQYSTATLYGIKNS